MTDAVTSRIDLWLLNLQIKILMPCMHMLCKKIGPLSPDFRVGATGD